MPNEPLKPVEVARIANLSSQADSLVKDDQQPQQIIDTLTKQGLYVDAIRFAAHSRDAVAAVKWACACIRALANPENDLAKDQSLIAAEAWANSPADPARRQAKAAAERSGHSSASDIVALACFYSGDTITDAGMPPVQPPPYMGNRLAGEAIQIAVITHQPQESEARYKQAIQLANG